MHTCSQVIQARNKAKQQQNNTSVQLIQDTAEFDYVEVQVWKLWMKWPQCLKQGEEKENTAELPTQPNKQPTRQQNYSEP